MKGYINMKLPIASHEIKEKTYEMAVDTPLPTFGELQPPQNRRKTNLIFLIIFAAFILSFLPLLIYTFCYSDINRFKGVDKCGNVCGEKNVRYAQWNCTGKDMTDKPIYTFVNYECVVNTTYNPYSVNGLINREGPFGYIRSVTWRLILISSAPIAICFILVTLFRYAPKAAVWSILLVFWLTITSIAIILFRWYGTHIVRTYTFLFVYIIVSILSFCVWIFVYLKYIRLATVLLKEAAKAVFDVKMMCHLSIGALFASTATLVAYAIISLHIASTGMLTEVNPGELFYVLTKTMRATIYLNMIITFWVVLCLLGIQYMTVGGAVARWYTTKNQEDLNDAVSSSLRVTMKYHLGNIALGSALMTLLFVPRLILQFLTMFSALKEKADAGMRRLDGYFTNNSYIMTAIHGTSFGESGEKAARLLESSVGNARDLNSFANYIIQMGINVIILLSAVSTNVLLRSNMKFSWTAYQFGIRLAYCEIAFACVCAHTILGPLKISTNTLFLRVSEELSRSKEDEMPYSMTMEEYLDGSYKLFLQRFQSSPVSGKSQRYSHVKKFVLIFASVSCVMVFVTFFV